MKAVIQRVNNASVEVEGNIVSAIGMGLFVLVGFHINDTQRDVDYIARKVVNLRLFEGEEGKMTSVRQRGYEVLCRSQITLCSHIKGFKLNYYQAMMPEQSRGVYQALLEALKREYSPYKIKEGLFQVHSRIHISNNGPLTIILDSHDKNWDKNALRFNKAAGQKRELI